MAKRNANTELNHDNWNDEQEPEEAGVFAKADNDTIKGRIIKKAKRRGITTDGGPSLFSGFAGFSKPATGGEKGVSSGAFDFLNKKSTNGGSSDNGKTDSAPAAASFNFTSPPSQTSSLFAFGGSSNAQSDTTSATFSFGNGSSGTNKNSSSENSGGSGIFAFGSGSNSSTFSFGKTTPEVKDTSAEKSNNSDKSETSEIKPLSESGEKTSAAPAAVKSKTEPEILPLISNPIVMPKTNKWSCPTCMIQNEADTEACVCCTTPKPGCKPKVEETKSFGGSVTSSGFKFGATSVAPSPAPTSGSGFSFGSNKSTPSETSNSVPTSSNDGKKSEEYSKEYLAHLKALNVQVLDWIKTHVEKNPYVFLSPVFKDYDKHLKDMEEKFKKPSTQNSGFSTESTPKDVSAASKPLLGAVFGSATGDTSTPKIPAEPVKFGTGSGFAFGSTSKTTTVESDAENKSTEKSNDEKKDENSSGFSFGSGNKSDDKKPASGFFGTSDTAASEKPTGFTFGSTIDKTASTGFSFGAKSTEDSSKSSSVGFTFGGGETKPAGSGFTFGSSTNGSTFGTTPSTGFSFGAAAAGIAANQEKKDEAAADEDDEPPKVEINQVVEEDAFHTVRCKLFYKKEKEFLEKGLGMLHLKKVENDTKVQMVVRAETNLGNILLNILVNDKMNVIKRKNNVQFSCVANPPIKGMEGPVIMLAKVKDSLMADQLEAKLEEATKISSSS